MLDLLVRHKLTGSSAKASMGKAKCYLPAT